MTITICVPWQDPYNHGDMWNELLAWCVEIYGLPGERVSFHPTEHYMDFSFGDEHDALMFQLKSGGFRKSANDVTTDFVGGIIIGS